MFVVKERDLLDLKYNEKLRDAELTGLKVRGQDFSVKVKG